MAPTRKPMRHDISAPKANDLIKERRDIKKQLQYASHIQEKVSEYNKAIVEGAKEDIEMFSKRTYHNNAIIVKLFMHDYLVDGDSELEFQIQRSSQIPIQDPSKPGENMMVDNPLPYRFEGIIVAMDESIPENDPRMKFAVGDYVRIEPQDLKEGRYYYHDRDRDYLPPLRDESEIHRDLFPNYKGYIKIHPSEVEFVVKSPDLL